MTRFLRRSASPSDDADAPTAPAAESTPPPPRRRSRARKAAPAADDNGSATTTETAAPSRRRRGGAGRSRKAAPRAASDAAADSGAESKPPPRSRAPRRATKAAAPPAPPTSEDDEVSTLIGLLRNQATLLERQNTLLTSLVEAQERSLRAVRPGAQAAARDGSELSVEIKPRLGIFVDVPNILYAEERAGVHLDWGKIAAFLTSGRTLVRAVAYAPISDDPLARRENERFVVPFMEHGYRIVTKPLKRFSGGSVKANFDVELALDIVTMADRLDVITLVSGDGDFRRCVEIVGNKGVRVEVMAFGQSTSQDLREVADRYIDIAAYIPQLKAD